MSTKPLFVNGWEVSGISSTEDFFLALGEILPSPANLCFEGTSMSPDAMALFDSNAATLALEMPPGTIWPNPSVFHVHATEQFLQQLVALAGKHAAAEICDHTSMLTAIAKD